jgi:hypothetical protein
VTALFVLQAPLCALACFSPADGSRRAESSPRTAHSCHEGPSESSPAGESGSHEECGCQLELEALVSHAVDWDAASVADFVFSRRPVVELAASNRSRCLTVARRIDLPPPDILLIKSTLII